MQKLVVAEIISLKLFKKIFKTSYFEFKNQLLNLKNVEFQQESSRKLQKISKNYENLIRNMRNKI